MNVKYKLSPTKSRLGNVPKKSTLSPNFQPSKSKRKLNIKSISQDKEETYFGSPKSKNYNIERVKSHK